MTFFELFLIAIGLSMDAFAVSVCKGLCMPKIRKSETFLIGLFFGGFQALMPFAGWILGTQFARYITGIDHWIVFILLAVIGGKMIWEALIAADEQSCPVKGVALGELFLLALATSIDAFAVGITFSFLQIDIIPAIVIIGCTTFLLSIAGVFFGHIFGTRYEKKAEIAGGIILILIGLKILLQHLGFINF
ncbi:MAG: manganese efflux pump MntP family protein [Treponema sp.]|jgi:putative Mn2+ efflux pump MntP|nr:manganese efflux pump MntP family protein [Treponema sp.]